MGKGKKCEPKRKRGGGGEREIDCIRDLISIFSLIFYNKIYACDLLLTFVSRGEEKLLRSSIVNALF